MSASVFISYRRADTGGYAFALWRELTRCFDPLAVFFDRDGAHLTLGRPWDDGLAAAIDAARACIVVIGPDWIDARDDQGRRRLDLPDDPVCQEIARALDRSGAGRGAAMRVIPVFFGGAAMPLAAQLPAALHDLPALHGSAIELSLDFDAPFQRLADELIKATGLARLADFTAHRQLCHLPSGAVQLFADPLNHLAGLRQRLAATGSAAVLAATTVQGMGGVGKTQLALHYAKAQRADYYGIWWFRAENASLLDQDCANFCDMLKLDVPQGRLHREVLRDHLASEPRWLLIYDNAEDERSLRDYLPAAGPHHVIVTSRRPQWNGVETLRLDVWTDEQALDFLRVRRPRVDDAEHCRLNQALAGLPLALEQACAYLEQTDLTLDDYLIELARLDDTEPLLDNAASDACPRSVAATLTLAYTRLSEPARELLHLCAWLAPEPIPEFLFLEQAEQLPAALAAVANVAAPHRPWRETVAELKNYALCQYDSTSASLSFHRLTLAALRLQRREQNAVDAASAIGLVRRAFPAQPKLPTHWSRCALLAPHAQQAADWQAQGLPGNDVAVVWLLDGLARYLTHARSLYVEAVALHRQALTLARTALGEENPDTLVAMNNLANTLRAQGDLAGAIELQKSVLATQCRVLGEEHPNTLVSMGNLASTLYAQGDLAGAIELQKSALAGRRRVLGEEHPDTLQSMSNLGSTLKAQGDLAGALELNKSALALRRHVLGEAHPDTINSAWNLFYTVLQLKDHATALDLFKQFLQPLLQAAPASLSADLRRIRTQLTALFHPPQEPTPCPAAPAFRQPVYPRKRAAPCRQWRGWQMEAGTEKARASATPLRLKNAMEIKRKNHWPPFLIRRQSS